MKSNYILYFFVLIFFSSCEKVEDILGKGKDNEKDVGTVFVADAEGYVYALNPANGSIKWDFKTGGHIYDRLIFEDGTVYANSEGDRVYALDALTGSLKWSFNTKNQYGYKYYSIAISKGLIYVNVEYEGLYALDAATGNVQWHFQEYSAIGGLSAPVVTEGLVFFSTNRNFYTLDSRTGNIKWSVNAPSVATFQFHYFIPTVDNGTVYLSSQNDSGYGQVYALDKMTGVQKWVFDTGKQMKYLKIFNEVLYVVAADDHGYLFAINQSDGKRKWVFETVKPMIPAIAISGDKVYVGSKDDYFYAIDVNNGSKRWSYEAQYLNSDQSSPVIEGDYCYFSGNDIFAVNKNTGQEKWRTDANKGAVLVFNGIVYGGDSDGFSALEATTGIIKWVFKSNRNYAFFTPCLLLKNGEVINAGEIGTILK